MANLLLLALLKGNVKRWNERRETLLFGIDINLSRARLRDADLTHADLSGANLSGANLSGANLSGANLRDADLTHAELYNADLSGADLSGADLSGANLLIANLSRAHLTNAHLSGADLTHAELHRADFNGADLSEATLPAVDLYGLGLERPEFYGVDLRNVRWVAPPPPSPPPAPDELRIDWTPIVIIGESFLTTAAALASIIQGLDVIERRWRERQAKRQRQGTPIHRLFSPSHKIPGSDQEIIDILLVMDDGSQHSFKRWVSDPAALRKYIDAFSDPASPVKPLQVVFRKREGAALRVDVTQGGKDNRQLNVILDYLEADPR